ncbi:class I SAM-dependent methyltransferase [Vagococcus elongatus]|uniref:Methyltransferase n=1 Tax=Vagococcus elongatus TaxID=180344 RepID=A0A430ALK0_9ENTE|nr:class I SAM-dependent methyltransferase [Vagococcus elongatus]RSU08956.1 methyltransferase [Vagococcus elongatus]
MTEHYFTHSPNTPHDREQWSFELKGKIFQFITDSHVFSKKTVDFGSRVLIDAFSDDNLPEGKILDVGCGYGPVGLALAYSTKRPVEMVDVNERAVALAEENATLNGIKEADVHVSDIYEAVHLKEYAVIVSNPPIRAGKRVVHSILEGACPLLAKGGTLTVVIQKKQGAPSAQKKMQEVFGNVEVVTRDKGYFILRSVKN